MNSTVLNLEKHALSLSQMEACARQIAQQLEPGDVITLTGEVGAGKTTFARALITAIVETPCEVTSPTFTLMQSYGVILQGNRPETLWHLDLYRLEALEEAYALGLEELWPHVVLIEWPAIIQTLLPQDVLHLTLDFASGAELRSLRYNGSARWESKLKGIV